MADPKVTVVVPVHNEGQWLAPALDSLLAQTYRPLEIVVVDDGSADGSIKIAEGYADRGVISFRFPENQGEAAARTKGIELGSGEIIVQVDADALFAPDFVERGMSHFREDPELVALSLGYLEVHPDLRGVIADYFRVKRAASRELRAQGGKDEIWTFFMYRRDAALSIGGYDSQFASGTDMDFGRRLRKAGYRFKNSTDTSFEHADPSTLGTFLKRTFNGSAYSRAVLLRYGMWPRGRAMVVLWARSVVVTLAPVFLVLGLWNLWWLVAAALALGSEAILPFVVDRESRLMAYQALRQRRYAALLLLPAIMLLRLRASAYGKLYAELFTERAASRKTFDV